MRAVLPEPTGLSLVGLVVSEDGGSLPLSPFLSFFFAKTCARCAMVAAAGEERGVCGKRRGVGAYPPIPTVKARSFQSRPDITGISRCA